MAAKRAAVDSAEKPKTRRPRARTPAPNAAQQPSQERRFVDVDPWAVLLEQLMEVPEEQTAERKPTKGK